MRMTRLLLNDVTAGAVCSLAAISFYISTAALLFQGTLSGYLSFGIGGALVGAVILAVCWARNGSIALAQSGAEPATVPLLAGMTADIAAQASGQAAFSTALMALSLTAMLVGGGWYLIGRFGAGNLIRFIPFPVIGGFLVSVAWLLLAGGIGMVAREPLTLGLLRKCLTDGPSAPLIVALAIAALFWGALQRSKHVTVLPALLVIFTLLVHGGLAVGGIDLATARAQGWLLPPFADPRPAFLWSGDFLGAVDWALLAHQLPAMAVTLVISVIALLLSESSMEVALDVRADFNRDLKTLGFGNAVLGLAGGILGGISIARSLLNRDARGHGRMSGAVTGLICVLTLLLGGSLVALIPKPVLGGLLVFMSLGTLKVWIIDGRRQLSRNDYAVVLTMLALTILVGYLPAVVAGIAVCCFDFAISVARAGQIRRDFSRNEWPSKVERGIREREFLKERGSLLHIVELQGTLFFGSVRELALRLETLIRPDNSIEQLIIDLRRVQWIDSSAAQSMARILKMAAKSGVKIAFSGARPPILKVLADNGCLPAAGPTLHADIDHAVIAWEDRHLEGVAPGADPIGEWLTIELGSKERAAALTDRLESVQLAPGDLLVAQGDEADRMYFVQEGRLSITVTAGGQSFVVRSIQAGGTIGEMGLYRDSTRNASVRAEDKTRLLCMTRDGLSVIEREDPVLAIALHKLFVRLLATRLDHANAQTSALVA